MGMRDRLARYSRDGHHGSGTAVRVLRYETDGVLVRNGNPGELSRFDAARREMKPIARRATRRVTNAQLRTLTLSAARETNLRITKEVAAELSEREAMAAAALNRDLNRSADWFAAGNDHWEYALECFDRYSVKLGRWVQPDEYIDYGYTKYLERVGDHEAIGRHYADADAMMAAALN